MITVSLVTEINCKNKLPGKCQKSGKNPRAEQLNSFPGSFQAGAEMMRPFLAGLNLGRWELGSHHRSNLVEKSCVRNNEEDTDTRMERERLMMFRFLPFLKFVTPANRSPFLTQASSNCVPVTWDPKILTCPQCGIIFVLGLRPKISH